MIAILKEGKSFEGFTSNKEYRYFDVYNIEQGNLTFNFVCDDNGKHRKLNEREFIMNFRSKYSDQKFV